ncbi:MAG: helix-turn-helix transcriptional regulator [Parvularculaceae bacterium]
MHTLQEYLSETGLSFAEFSRSAGIDVSELNQIVTGEKIPSIELAMRISDLTDGVVTLERLTGGDKPVVDARTAFVRGAVPINEELLAQALSLTLPEILGGDRRRGDSALPQLAAEAAANTYDALATVSSHQGVDRLVQALRPVLLEILAESFVVQIDRSKLEAMLTRTSELYFQARQEKRRE